MNVVQKATNTRLNQECRRELTKWIFPDDVDPDESYKSALSVRKAMTGIWFLESNQFKTFIAEGSGVFWLYGNRESFHVQNHA